ncbi:MAG: hypothetical protein M1814_000363 [Vezdaea aestivalis]|nr:MAG: hypothetical protein M1814_000363 [Vezdaea aestivalis]
MDTKKSDAKLLLQSPLEYFEWSYYKETELKGSGIWWVVKEDDPLKDDVDVRQLSIGAERKNKKPVRPLAEWRNANLQAIMAITSSLGPTLLSTLGNLTSAHQYWKKLGELYENTWNVRRWALLEKLMQVPLKIWKNLDAKASRLRTLNRELRLVAPEDALSDRALAVLLMQGLSREYNVIKDNFMSTDQDKIYEQKTDKGPNKGRNDKVDWTGLVAALKAKENEVKRQVSLELEAKRSVEVNNSAKVFTSRGS